MKSILFFGFLFICILFSCSPKQEKTINMEDLLDVSTDTKKSTPSIDTSGFKIRTQIKLSHFSKRLLDTLGLTTDSIKIINDELFPDRFHPLKSEKWIHQSNQQKLVYYHWKFNDTLITQSTFLNWMDDFGDKRISLRSNLKQRISKNANLLLVQDKSIVRVESTNVIDISKLLPVLDTLGYGKYWKYCIFQQKMKTTKWLECSSDTSECFQLKNK